MISKESFLHGMVCDYLRLQYPSTLFRTDFAAGIKMTIGQASKHKRLQAVRAWPDLFIAESNGKYPGLFIELKAAGVKLVTMTGNYTTPHLKEQAKVLAMLRTRGFKAEFGVGFEHTKEIIDGYFGKA